MFAEGTLLTGHVQYSHACTRKGCLTCLPDSNSDDLQQTRHLGTIGTMIKQMACQEEPATKPIRQVPGHSVPFPAHSRRASKGCAGVLVLTLIDWFCLLGV